LCTVWAGLFFGDETQAHQLLASIFCLAATVTGRVGTADVVDETCGTDPS